jgi:hypothetical protein
MDHFLVYIINQVSDSKLNSHSCLFESISLLMSDSLLPPFALQMVTYMTQAMDPSYITSSPLSKKTRWIIAGMKGPDTWSNATTPVPLDSSFHL